MDKEEKEKQRYRELYTRLILEAEAWKEEMEEQRKKEKEDAKKEKDDHK